MKKIYIIIYKFCGWKPKKGQLNEYIEGIRAKNEREKAIKYFNQTNITKIL